jgi:ethanolamine utilization protein EutA
MLLLGLDFGSTTSSALIVEARVLVNCVTGRREFGPAKTLYRSQSELTPLEDERLDETRLAALIDAWLAESGVMPQAIQAGGAIVTGLAARAQNTSAVGRLVKSRVGEALIATAGDPCLEAWLAFMGNALSLSRGEPDADFANLDIGGGTTNLAWGRGGQVHSTGCWFLGARHVQFLPGSYQIVKLSPFAERLLPALGITSASGDELSAKDLATLLEFQVAALETIATGDASLVPRELLRPLEQVRCDPPPAEAIVTFSGGVGELIYRHAAGELLPSTTAFGDLGIDLAKRIAGSPRLSQHVRSHVPPHAGRATVAGLTIHNTELSGNTLFLPRPETLPWCDLPLLGSIAWRGHDEAAQAAEFERQLRPLLELAARQTSGSCLAIDCRGDDHQSVKQLGERLARLLEAMNFPADRRLVLLVSANIGKTLGQYATRWGKIRCNLAVLDEIPDRQASFVTLGRLSDQSVPLSFYGISTGSQNDA